MKKAIIAVSIIALIAVLTAGIIIFWPSGQSFGSVSYGNDYEATSTVYYGIRSSQLIKGGYGSLGSVIITTAGDLAYRLMDDTDGVYDSATTSKLLADIPASLAAGTYTFDVVFTDGLYLEVISGTNATGTITYR